MTNPITFAFGVHAHQPVGNFDHVMAQATNDCYASFLDLLEKFPSIHGSVHISGPLLDWLLDKRPDVVDRVRRMCRRKPLWGINYCHGDGDLYRDPAAANHCDDQ